MGDSRRRSTSNTKNLNREGSEEVDVNVSSTTVLGKTNVKEKNGLEDPVEGDIVKDKSAPELNNGETGINNPVGQELSIVIRVASLKGLKRVIGRDDNRSKVSQKLTNSKNKIILVY